jgi:hypothetical protein
MFAAPGWDDFHSRAIQKSSHFSSVLRLGYFGYHLELKAALSLLLWVGESSAVSILPYHPTLTGGYSNDES